MKKIFIIYLCIFSQIVYSQENLVHNGDFEFAGNEPVDMIYINGLISNPKIPCMRPTYVHMNEYTHSADYSEFHWNVFGANGNNSGSGKPDLFDSRYYCNDFDNTNVCYPVFQIGSIIDCEDDTYNIGIPNNYYGTQNHYSPITNIAGRYVGLKSGWFGSAAGGAAIDRDPGIYIKLKRPLKCGYVYHLKFNAVYKGGTNHTLRIRLGTGDRWNQDHVTINSSTNTIHKDITTEGGTNNDQWQNVDIPFYVDESNVQWLFIRSPDATFPWQSAKILIDDIEILDQCSVDFVCDQHIDNNVDIISNNTHTNTNPLTFFNTEYQSDITIIIYPINQNTPVRTIHIIDPAPRIAWDGMDNFGNPVANGPYRYEVFYGNNCTCKTLKHNFMKVADKPCFATTWGTDANTGALTFYNLDNVGYMKVTIYDINLNYLTTFEVYSPGSTISWDGRFIPNTNGSAVIPFPPGEWCDHPTYFYFDLKLSSECCKYEYKEVLFLQQCFASPSFSSLPQFSFKPVSKDIECDFYYNYAPYFVAPKPCCDEEIDLFLEDVTISGDQDFKLIHDIQAGPKVVIATNSDILFQAGNEIRLVQDFTTEPGAEFVARIEPCVKMATENEPMDIVQWTSFPEVTTNEKTTLPEVIAVGSLSIFPNPTSNDLFIQSGSGIKSVEVFDLTGKLVLSESYNKNNFVKIEASSLLNGVYVLQIILEDGSIQVRKVIKN